MSRQFSASFNVTYELNTSPTEWDITGKVIDNTGNYFATDVMVGDIIYLDGSMFGLGALRYIIKTIDLTNTIGIELHATISWDMGEDSPMEPYADISGIIGAATDNLKIATLPSTTISMLNESFINAIKNFENKYIIDKLAPIDSPHFTGEATVETVNIDSNDNDIANTEWVNKRIANIEETEEYIALENITAYDILYVDGNGGVGLADANIRDNSDRIIGIALETKSQNDTIKVALAGKIQNLNWNFTTTGQLIFVGLNGNFTLQPDTVSGFVQQIGIVADKHTISLDIEEAILL